jgi:iron(III) transport system ATP-binding protein
MSRTGARPGPAPGPLAVEIRGLAKAYGRRAALSGVDLDVPEGVLLAVLGPSGSGKTTLLRCLAGFERADAGEIVVSGRRVAGPRLHTPPHIRGVAVVPQEGALFPHLSVAGNVAYGLDRSGRRGDRVAAVLDLVGLAELAGRMPHELSGGQQQRVAVARALAPRPRVVLLDEPFSALDAALRTDLRRDVRAALRVDGATAVLVTHDQGEALSIADRVAVMRDGRIQQVGTPREVYGAPADTWVAGFVGEAVLLPARVDGTVARTALGPLALLDPGRTTDGVTVLIRPEQVRLLPPESDGGVPATVVRCDYHGHDALLTLRLADGTTVAARVFDSQTAVRPGDRVAVRVDGPARSVPPASPGSPSGPA